MRIREQEYKAYYAVFKIEISHFIDEKNLINISFL